MSWIVGLWGFLWIRVRGIEIPRLRRLHFRFTGYKPVLLPIHRLQTCGTAYGLLIGGKPATGWTCKKPPNNHIHSDKQNTSDKQKASPLLTERISKLKMGYRTLRSKGRFDSEPSE